MYRMRQILRGDFGRTMRKLNLPKFNPLPKIIEIAKDKEVPRQIIINDLEALEKELRELLMTTEKQGFEVIADILGEEIYERFI